MKIDFDLLKVMTKAGATADVIVAVLEEQYTRGEVKRKRDKENMIMARAGLGKRQRATNGDSERHEQTMEGDNARQRATVWPDDYEAVFWREYPRRIGKRSAVRKLQTIWKSDEVSWDVLIGAVKLYAKEVAGKETRYIAHPATWLNAGRWEDETDTPKDSAPEITPRNGTVYGNQIWFHMESPEYRQRGETRTDRFCGWWFPTPETGQ